MTRCDKFCDPTVTRLAQNSRSVVKIAECFDSFNPIGR